MSQPTAEAKTREPLSHRQVRRWTIAVFCVFFVCGIGIASWMSRIPAIRDSLGASTFQMGMLVIGGSVGSMVGLASSSHLIARYGAKRTMLSFVMLMLCGLAVAGVGSMAPSYWLILAGLAMFGMGTGTCDVAMNVSGAANERVMGRSLMPLFHAMFSLGTMAGAGIGALAEKLGVDVVWHLIAVAVVAAGGILLAIPHVQPESSGVQDTDESAAHGSWRVRLSVWKQSATLLIGLIVLGMALAEGSAGDWLALAMVDDRGTTNATGAVIYGVFVSAMTVGRVVGVVALDRYGRVTVLRASALTGVIGLGLVVGVPNLIIAVIGTVLWGLGASLGFPVGMSAAADDPRNAAARVSAVATIGYLAFLVGPPGIGLLGEHAGLLNALIVVLVLIVVAGIAAPAARERRTSSTQPGRAGRPGADRPVPD